MITHKIAIIKTRDVYNSYGDDYDTVVHSITDWTEVSHEDFVLLQKAASRVTSFAIRNRKLTSSLIAGALLLIYISLPS